MFPRSLGQKWRPCAVLTLSLICLVLLVGPMLRAPVIRVPAPTPAYYVVNYTWNSCCGGAASSNSDGNDVCNCETASAGDTNIPVASVNKATATNITKTTTTTTKNTSISNNDVKVPISDLDKACQISNSVYDMSRLINYKNVFQEEVRHVIYAKVHKAASSTMQNIFLRFAMARNLSAMLPSTHTSIGESTDRVGRLVPPYKHSKGKYDILCNHLVFNPQIVSRYFPPDAVRVATVREPMKLAVSALAYYTTTWPSAILKQGHKLHPTDPINAFIKTPTDFCQRGNVAGSYVNNRMSFDLGVSTRNFESFKTDQGRKCEFLKKLDREFDIVLVVDYFDESMVLMKRLLNWQLKDVLYIKVNSLKQPETSVWKKKPIVTPENSKSFRQWAAVDYAVYDHFVSRFLETLQRQSNFSEEVEAFRSMLSSVRQYCIETEKSVPLVIAKSQWNEEFKISADDCRFMTMGEPNIVATARNRQRGG